MGKSVLFKDNSYVIAVDTSRVWQVVKHVADVGIEVVDPFNADEQGFISSGDDVMALTKLLSKPKIKRSKRK